MTPDEAGAFRGLMRRAWREFAGVQQKTLAERLGYSPSAVANWEKGTRGSRTARAQPDVERLAAALGLGPDLVVGMVDLMSAAGSPLAQRPRARWAHNFADPPRPAWFWIRPGTAVTQECQEDERAPQHVVAGRGWWGEPFQGQFSVECGRAGVLVTVPTTTPNPPLEVTLTEPGWVDFGNGVIPDFVAQTCGLMVVDGRTLMAAAVPLDADLDADDRRFGGPVFAAARTVAQRFGLNWALIAPHIGLLKPKELAHSLDGMQLSAANGEEETGWDEFGRQVWVTGEELKAFREGRGLTRAEVVAFLAALQPGVSMSAARLERVERGTGSLPAGPALAGLAHVYRSDGRLGLERVYWSARHSLTRPVNGDSGVVEHKVRFPDFYTGPVWVRVTTATGDPLGKVTLTWGWWRRRQWVRSGMTLTTRKAFANSEPLLVQVPVGWIVEAGTGVSPTATDINHGWYPVSFGAAMRLLGEGVRSVLNAQLGGTPATKG